MNEESEEQLTSQEAPDIDDESVVHTAVGILRKRIKSSKTQPDNDAYYSSDDMSK